MLSNAEVKVRFAFVPVVPVLPDLLHRVYLTGTAFDNGPSHEAGSEECKKAVMKFNRLARDFLEIFDEEDLPRAIRYDKKLCSHVSSTTDYMATAGYFTSARDATVGGMLNRTSGIMAAAREAVRNANDPRLRHSAPLARAAKVHGELVRQSENVRRAFERQESMTRLRG